MTQQTYSPVSLQQRILSVLLGLALLLSGLVSLDRELHRDAHSGTDCKSTQCAATLFAAGAVSTASGTFVYHPPLPNFQGFLPSASNDWLPSGAIRIRAARDPPVYLLQAAV